MDEKPTTTKTPKTRNTGRVVIQSYQEDGDGGMIPIDVAVPRVVKKKGMTPEDVTTTEDAKAWIVAEGEDGKKYRIIRVMHVVTAKKVAQTKLIED